MLLEFKTPINQSSSLIQKSQHRIQGICSHYIYMKNNEKFATTVNLNHSKEINNINDYFYFYEKINSILTKILILTLFLLIINTMMKYFEELMMPELLHQT